MTEVSKLFHLVFLEDSGLIMSLQWRIKLPPGSMSRAPCYKWSGSGMRGNMFAAEVFALEPKSVFAAITLKYLPSLFAEHTPICTANIGDKMVLQSVFSWFGDILFLQCRVDTDALGFRLNRHLLTGRGYQEHCIS